MSELSFQNSERNWNEIFNYSLISEASIKADKIALWRIFVSFYSYESESDFAFDLVVAQAVWNSETIRENFLIFNYIHNHNQKVHNF